MQRKEMDKRGQVTIFIIIAIVIVSSILVFFLWIKPRITVSDAKIELQGCMEKAVKDNLEILGKQAGFNEPEFYYMYKNDKIGYLCYINTYYTPCINQKPFIKQHLESELTKAIKQQIYNCYDDSLEDLKAMGYDVTSGEKDLIVSIEPNQILIELDAPVTVTKEASARFTRFKTIVNSPLYTMIMVATSIIQYETSYGDADTTTLMNYYPDLLILKLKQGDGTTLYFIEDKKTATKFNFASRSYAWAPGYGLDKI